MGDPTQREETVFNAALKLPPGERTVYLQETCGADVQFRARIEALLRTIEPTVAPQRTIVVSMPVTEKPGDRIGRYKLLEQIGEGGFGVVYVAQQEEPVLRRVALKVIKMGMDTKEVVARFEAERQALALMEHPNIAKVLDAGATATGRPFFVMELVKGEWITEYCDKNNLTTRQRLDLFVQICHAIQHAHQKGIIHRDIKPSNILVAMHDGVPVPKVIDFGIAKATEQRLTNATIYTALEQIIGTPAYMSPEQAEMSAIDIDTRSDIYSLGVLLYELLTDKTPFDPHELVAAGRDAMRRTIREQEPQRPSTRLTTMADGELIATAKRRQTEAPKLVHLLRGDLDWIVMKCLEKDRTRRYETANGLASDLQRHINNEPVLARPPSQLYQLQKMVRRNKLAFAAAAAVALALIVGLGLSTWLFFKEKDARQRAVAAENAQSLLRQQAETDEHKARSEAAKSLQVAQFLKEMLNGVGPSVALGRDTTMLREILDKTAERIGQDLNEQPDVGADVRTTISEVYYALAEYPKAEAMASEAVSIRRKLFGKDNLELAQSLDDLGVALQKQLKEEEAIRVHREALAIRKKQLGDEDPNVAKSLCHLGEALNSDDQFKEAEKTLREAVSMQRRLFGNEHLDLAQSLGILANSLMFNEKLSESEIVGSEALAISRKLLGNEDPGVAGACQVLANTLRREGKLSEAEDLYREAYELRGKLLGKDHPFVGQSRGQLIALLRQEGKLAEVVSVYRKAADQGDAVAQGHLGWIYANGTGVAKDPSEAFKWCRKAADQGNATGQFYLGECYEQGWGVEKDLAKAVEWYRKATDQNNQSGQCCLGVCYEQGWGVEKDLAKAAEWFGKAADQGHAGAQSNLGMCYEQGWGVEKDLAKAMHWYAKAAAQGNITAQYRLAWMYKRGEGVPKDDIESVKYFAAIEKRDVQTLNDFAWTLAVSKLAELRDGTNAVRYAEKAVTATHRTNAMYLGTLAAAYAEVQQFDKAVAVQQEAMALPQSEQKKKDYTSRLKLYQFHSPYREP